MAESAERVSLPLLGSRERVGASSVDREKVSVIVPAYNLEGVIGEALASIEAQTRAPQEIIVVDDGSSDKTPALLAQRAQADRRYRILRSARRGPSGARNIGLSAATGDIIAFLDGDDAWPRDKIERQMKRLSAPDQPDVVSGLTSRFADPDPANPAPARAEAPGLPGVCLGASLFRRGVFDRVGNFDESLSYSEDHDLMFRVREAGLKVVILNAPTLLNRRRRGSLTQNSDTPRDFDLLKILRLSLARRRRRTAQGEVYLHLAPLVSLIER